MSRNISQFRIESPLYMPPAVPSSVMEDLQGAFLNRFWSWWSATVCSWYEAKFLTGSYVPDKLLCSWQAALFLPGNCAFQRQVCSLQAGLFTACKCSWQDAMYLMWRVVCAMFMTSHLVGDRGVLLDRTPCSYKSKSLYRTLLFRRCSWQKAMFLTDGNVPDRRQCSWQKALLLTERNVPDISLSSCLKALFLTGSL
jgi:hypothetical protein